MEQLRRRAKDALARKIFRSRKEFARLAKVSENTIKALVNGTTRPDPGTVEAVARVLDEMDGTVERKARPLPLTDFLKLALAAVEAAELHGADVVEERIRATGGRGAKELSPETIVRHERNGDDEGRTAASKP